jgi:hypothetical protein
MVFLSKAIRLVKTQQRDDIIISSISLLEQSQLNPRVFYVTEEGIVWDQLEEIVSESENLSPIEKVNVLTLFDELKRVWKRLPLFGIRHLQIKQGNNLLLLVRFEGYTMSRLTVIDFDINNYVMDLLYAKILVDDQQKTFYSRLITLATVVTIGSFFSTRHISQFGKSVWSRLFSRK